MNAFPQSQGVIIDSPGEQSYELAFFKGGETFEVLEADRRRYPHVGVDPDRMERGAAHLRERFHNLTPSMVRYYSPGGVLGRVGALRPERGCALLATEASGGDAEVL